MCLLFLRKSLEKYFYQIILKIIILKQEIMQFEKLFEIWGGEKNHFPKWIDLKHLYVHNLYSIVT